jgi:hypothetical protein
LVDFRTRINQHGRKMGTTKFGIRVDIPFTPRNRVIFWRASRITSVVIGSTIGGISFDSCRWLVGYQSSAANAGGAGWLANVGGPWEPYLVLSR